LLKVEEPPLLTKTNLWARFAGLVVILNSFAVSAELLIADGYVRGLPPGQPNTAAFMRLVNRGTEPLTINHAESAAAELAEFHGHQQKGGMVRMHKLDGITIAAGEEFVLLPGDHHLMLLKLLRPLREGDQVAITLRATNGESATALLPVRSVLNEHRHHSH
jgi:copper(I)-binding protein